MTDFVRRALYPERDDWIIRSLLDIDFYKINMGHFELEAKTYSTAAGKDVSVADLEVTYGLINRSSKIPLGLIVDEGEFRRQLNHAMELRLDPSETAYLSGMDAYNKRLYPESYIEWLKSLHLCSYELKRNGDQYDFRVKAKNRDGVSFWETIAMCILLELKTRAVLRFMTRFEVEILYSRAKDKLFRKLRLLKQYPGIMIVNFGTRRRHSHLWEKFVSEMCKAELGSQFRGISNVLHAKDLAMTPSGTNAHQIYMQSVTMAYPSPAAMIEAQYTPLYQWEKLFPSALCIELSDAYGSDQFYKNMPEELAVRMMKGWRGSRHDSAEAAVECRKYIARCHQYGVDPRQKLYIFSDGLTHTQIVELYLEFGHQIQLSFGWGTNLTNDFLGCHPDFDQPFTHIPRVHLTWDEMLGGMSLVCKVIEVNGVPAVKISNNPNKATGNSGYVGYYKKVFGIGQQAAQEVLV